MFIRTALALLFLAGIAVQPAHAQRRSKRDNEDRGQEAFSPYAYETEATTKRKTRERSFSGKQDRYSVERPVSPTEFGRNERGVDYAKAPYFGHLRPVIKRPPGKQKLCRECGIRH